MQDSEYHDKAYYDISKRALMFAIEEDKGYKYRNDNKHSARNNTQAKEVISLAIAPILLDSPVGLTQ